MVLVIWQGERVRGAKRRAEMTRVRDINVCNVDRTESVAVSNATNNSFFVTRSARHSHLHSYHPRLRAHHPIWPLVLRQGWRHPVHHRLHPSVQHRTEKLRRHSAFEQEGDLEGIRDFEPRYVVRYRPQCELPVRLGDTGHFKVMELRLVHRNHEGSRERRSCEWWHKVRSGEERRGAKR